MLRSILSMLFSLEPRRACGVRSMDEFAALVRAGEALGEAEKRIGFIGLPDPPSDQLEWIRVGRRNSIVVAGLIVLVVSLCVLQVRLFPGYYRVIFWWLFIGVSPVVLIACLLGWIRSGRAQRRIQRSLDCLTRRWKSYRIRAF